MKGCFKPGLKQPDFLEAVSDSKRYCPILCTQLLRPYTTSFLTASIALSMRGSERMPTSMERIAVMGSMATKSPCLKHIPLRFT